MIESQSKALKKYIKEKAIRFTISFYPPEKEMGEWLKSKGNVNAYVKKILKEKRENEKLSK